MNKKQSFWFIVGTLTQIGFIITIPVAILAFVGAKLDKAYHTTPLFILAGMGLSIFISGIAIYFKIKQIEKNQEK